MHVVGQPPAAPARGAPGLAPATGPARALEPVLRPLRAYGEYILAAASALGVILALWAAFFYAPTEAIQGDVQRIEYVHVPLAWVAYLAFFVVFVASILYLWRRDERWD